MKNAELNGSSTSKKPSGPCTGAAFGSGDRRFGSASSPHFGELKSLAADNRGVAMIEYAILCAVVALTILAALMQLGGGVGANFNEVDQQVGDSIHFEI